MTTEGNPNRFTVILKVQSNQERSERVRRALDQRTALLSRYHAGGTMNESRALVVREAAESEAFANAVYNRSFGLMEYFGYLRRGAEPQGYAFWLNALNTSDAGNYRGMVCSFLTSMEYQRRFGSVITRSNSECGR